MPSEPERLFNEYTDWAKTLAKWQEIERPWAAARMLPGQMEQAALLGLWQACQKYDGTALVSFKQFAVSRILGSMRDEVNTETKDLPQPELNELCEDDNHLEAYENLAFMLSTFTGTRGKILRLKLLKGWRTERIAKAFRKSPSRIYGIVADGMELLRQKYRRMEE